MNHILRSIAVLIVFLFSQAAHAQCVKVAADICVTKKGYDAPINEQPFFGFANKTQVMLDADEKFIEAVGGVKGLSNSLESARIAFARDDYVIAARRLNQAFLLEKRDSRIYHGFAQIAYYRFKDVAFADELFQIAKRLPNPYLSLNADYGRLLMVAKRHADALPILEQAVKDTPKSALAWSDLAFARVLAADAKGACAAVEETLRLSPPEYILNGINLMRSKLDCK